MGRLADRRWSRILPRAAAVTAISMMTTAPCFAQVRFIVTDLGALDGPSGDSAVHAINAGGKLAGMSRSAQGDRAFLWSEGLMTDLGVLPGQSFSAAAAINAVGSVVGVSGVGAVERGALWQGGGATDLGLPAGFMSNLPSSINDAMQISGSLRDGADFADRAYRWQGGTTTILTETGGGAAFGYGMGLNAAGDLAGFAGQGMGVHAFRWQNGIRTDLPDLTGGADYSEALAANDFNQVVGFGSGPNGERAVLWNGGVATDLGDLPGGADQSFATAINNAGQVVGASGTATGQHAFVWSANMGMRDLNDLLVSLGWTLREAIAINDLGQIAANGVDGRKSRGLLLTPTGTVNWKPGAAGNLLDPNNWQDDLGFTRPTQFVGGVIAPSSSQTVSLDSVATLRSLTVGGGGGNVTLAVGAAASLNLVNPSALAAGSALSVTGGNVQFAGGLTNAGDLSFGPGSRDVAGAITNAVTGKITVNGVGTTRFTGPVTNASGARIEVAAGATAIFQGGVLGPAAWTGAGTKVFEGDIQIGTNCAVHSGNVTLGSSASLIIEISGAAACTQQGRFTVQQALDLGGSTLRLVLTGGYVPQPGQRFTILQWGSRAGVFGSVDLGQAVLPSGLSWDLSSLYATGEVFVTNGNGGGPGGGDPGATGRTVPMPDWATGLLGVILAGGILVRSRRHRNSRGRRAGFGAE